MKKTSVYAKLGLLVLTGSIILLSACEDQSEKIHSEAIESGLDALVSENYDKAEVYFEMALKEKSNDETTQNLLDRTVDFNEAKRLFNDGKNEKALEKIDGLLQEEKIDEDSYVTIKKASEVLKDSIEDENSKITEKMEKVDVEEKEEVTEAEYTYNDFKGVYAHFESTPYQSPIDYVIELTDSHYLSGFWKASYSVSNILDKRIKDNLLEIDYFTPESAGDGSSSGLIELQLKYENNQKFLVFTDSEYTVYPVTEQQLLDNEWVSPPKL